MIPNNENICHLEYFCRHFGRALDFADNMLQEPGATENIKSFKAYMDRARNDFAKMDVETQAIARLIAGGGARADILGFREKVKLNEVYGKIGECAEHQMYQVNGEWTCKGCGKTDTDLYGKDYNAFAAKVVKLADEMKVGTGFSPSIAKQDGPDMADKPIV